LFSCFFFLSLFTGNDVSFTELLLFGVCFLSVLKEVKIVKCMDWEWLLDTSVQRGSYSFILFVSLQLLCSLLISIYCYATWWVSLTGMASAVGFMSKMKIWVIITAAQYCSLQVKTMRLQLYETPWSLWFYSLAIFQAEKITKFLWSRWNFRASRKRNCGRAFSKSSKRRAWRWGLGMESCVFPA